MDGDKEKDAQLRLQDDGFFSRSPSDKEPGVALLADITYGMISGLYSAIKGKQCPERSALTVVHVAVSFSRVELDRP